jgi:hypothetical protein
VTQDTVYSSCRRRGAAARGRALQARQRDGCLRRATRGRGGRAGPARARRRHTDAPRREETHGTSRRRRRGIVGTRVQSGVRTRADSGLECWHTMYCTVLYCTVCSTRRSSTPSPRAADRFERRRRRPHSPRCRRFRLNFISFALTTATFLVPSLKTLVVFLT